MLFHERIPEGSERFGHDEEAGYRGSDGYTRYPPEKSRRDQHFPSQEKADWLSEPAPLSHRSMQALQVANIGSVTRVQLPPPVSHRAYCRHLSPSRYSMVQTWGAFAPQARSRPWQVVSPQEVLPGVPEETGVVGIIGGTTGDTGAGFPGDGEVQPAISRDTIMSTLQP